MSLITFTPDNIEYARPYGEGFEVVGLDTRTQDRVVVLLAADVFRILTGRARRGADLAAAVNDPRQVRDRVPLRVAKVARNNNGRPDPETVAAYLPGNYHLAKSEPGEILIAGYDNAGWTLDGYVIPRLASGMIYAREVQ